jgi:CSLREA domain-containing protein
MLGLAGQAQAATFTVNKTEDTADPNGCVSVPSCSPREAIAAANNAPGSTVSVPAGHFTLTMGDLVISADMTITGAGARNTIFDGGGNDRVFDITNTSTVNIQNLAVTGGQTSGDGGGIFTEGNLNLTAVSIHDNTAGFGGGGVATIGPFPEDPTNFVITLTIDRSTVSNNHVTDGVGNGQGGGIMSFGNLNVTNSTIVGNSVSNTGSNSGGGIISSSGDFETSGITTLLNTTITGNSVSGGTDGFGGGISGGQLTDDLLPSRGLQTPFSADLRATNTIVANNLVSGAKQDCALLSTSSTNHNISSDSTCGFGDGGSKQNTDPVLGLLQDNGGPTDTESAQTGSPALDAGTNSGCPSTDQRGVGRPQRGTCDIGAYEWAPPTAVTGDATGVTSSRLKASRRARIAASATIHGTATNPFIEAAFVQFQYGTSTNYGLNSPTTTVPAGASGTAVSASLTGLAANTTYHYRLVVANRDGVSLGADRTFSTAALSKPKVSIAGVPRSCVKTSFVARVRVRVAKGTKLRSVRVRVDKKLVKTSKKSSFRVRIPVRGLRAGRHTISVRATDRGRRNRLLRRSFSRCRAPVVAPRFTG